MRRHGQRRRARIGDRQARTVQDLLPGKLRLARRVFRPVQLINRRQLSLNAQRHLTYRGLPPSARGLRPMRMAIVTMAIPGAGLLGLRRGRDSVALGSVTTARGRGELAALLRGPRLLGQPLVDPVRQHARPAG